ncbi:hypothetical protein LZ32DRAFT_307873 [Colletotrichum eremochloae]|nr:hypothetical protein LZ32DRAFT_307873 [Colletotrichum eremochloae]
MRPSRGRVILGLAGSIVSLWKNSAALPSGLVQRDSKRTRRRRTIMVSLSGGVLILTTRRVLFVLISLYLSLAVWDRDRHRGSHLPPYVFMTDRLSISELPRHAKGD